MYVNHCGTLRIPPNRSGILERRSFVLPSWEMLDIGTRMPGFRLMLQDDKGQYPHSGCALIFEGSMLVYDPQ